MTRSLAPHKINIAIDGHASTGKSTTAKELAKRLGYVYVDTGAMYRAMTLWALENGWIGPDFLDKEALIASLDRVDIRFRFNPATGKSETFLNGINVEDQIRRPGIADYVSRVAEIPEVRRKLVEIQQQIAREKGVIMDGRDIGTVVMPDAELKIFMTASPEIRAERRFRELREKGMDVNYEEILRNVRERDRIDSTRKASPLRKAGDARLLDNSQLSPQEQYDIIMNWVKEVLREKGGI